MKKFKPLPPSYFNLSVLIIFVLHFIFPLYEFLYFPLNLMGIFFILFGIVLNLKADNDFKKMNTTVKPFEKSTSLITSGVFKLSRHPMYLGMTSILLGIAIILGTVSPFLICILFVIAMEIYFIQHEEKMLHEVFGEEYLNYKSKVHRWI